MPGEALSGTVAPSFIPPPGDMMKTNGEGGTGLGAMRRFWRCLRHGHCPLRGWYKKPKHLSHSSTVEFEDLLQVKGSWILELGNVAD